MESPKQEIAAIIQARMGSSRLPAKVLADVCGRPMLQRLIDRIECVPEVDRIIVATTDGEADDQLAAWVSANTRCELFRGAENDVLDRFYQCARLAGASIVVRVTADDPLKDPALISHAIGCLLENPNLDYCSNTMRPTYPEGLDIEVFRFSALERAFREASLPSDREHVTPFIWRQPELFRGRNFEFERDLSAWRWTVDKPNDLEFIRRIYAEFQGWPDVSYLEIIDLLERNPQLMLINQGTVRNEGYIKSLCQEKK
jgi:spore coat polysaccharide biosynthesis protein SpsF